MMTRLFLFFVLFLSGAFLRVQGQNALSFQSLNEKFGISLRETTSACMDRNGFVWIASKMGILRVSEDDYRIYQLPYDSPDVVFVKLHYANGTLYVYSNNGQVFVYNAVSDRFELFLHVGKELDAPFLMVFNMEVDEVGRLWFSSSSGLIKCSGQEVSQLTQLGAVFHLTLSGDQLWVAGDTSLLAFDVYGSGKGRVVRKLERGLRVSKMFFDSEDHLWVGTDGRGLFKMDEDGDDLQPIPGLPRQPVLAMEEIGDSLLLIGIDGQGLWEVNRYDLSIQGVYKENADNSRSLRGNGVYDIFNDGRGRIWVCTFTGGASYYVELPASVQHIEHLVNDPNSLVNNDVNDVLEDRRGNLWLATNNGISRWVRSAQGWQSIYHTKQQEAHVFLSLCEDTQGNIWAGTYGAGVYVVNGVTGEEMAHYADHWPGTDFRNNYVYDIFSDSKERLWFVGVRGDVLSYNAAEGTFNHFGNHPVNVIKELPSGEMLLGCSYGISLLNLENGTADILLNGYLVQDVWVQDQAFWLCTVGDGLVRYDRLSGAVVSYSIEEGLPSAFVNSIQVHDGAFWLGTENGLCKFDPLTQKVETFPSTDVLARQSFNRKAHAALKSGELAFGTNRGLVVFDPKHLLPAPAEGRIYIQDISVSGRSVRDGFLSDLAVPADSIEELRLRHIHNTLSMEMLPLGAVFSPRFSWKLEGFDKDWHQPGDNRVLYYSNLPSGEFQLKLRMYDNAMSEVVDERVFLIKKAPPYWETWWFLLSVALVLTVGFILVMRYYMGLVRQLHSEQKIRFFANTAHDMRTSLTLIAAPVKELAREEGLSEKGQYYLSLARSQVDRLVGVVTQLMDFQKADVNKEQLLLQQVDLSHLVTQRVAMFQSYAQNNDLELIYDPPGEVLWARVDEGMLVKVVDNLLSNAIKYSLPGKRVWVRLQAQKSKVFFEVKDEGIGIAREARSQLFREFYRGHNAINSRVVGSGIGLLMTQKYVKLHGGVIEWKSEENKGSVFTVVLPRDTGDMAGTPVDWSPDPEVTGSVVAPEASDSPKDFTVLVVEDNVELQTFLKTALQDRFKVEVADDGIRGWELMKDLLPDLVVSDVLMPGRDGFELCRLAKSTFDTAHIPFVLLTALSGEGEHLRGLGLGADDYIIKPFDFELLAQKIASIIHNRRVISERALQLSVGPREEPLLGNEINDAFLKRAMEVVEAHLANSGFNKEQFAAEMNVSGSLLYKKIKSLTDESPSDFIRNLRLARSLEFLQSGSYSITEVSELCGFTTVGYFSTVFKKHYGKSPSEVVPR